MIEFLTILCERILRIPPPPQAPPGDEATTRRFRAAQNYYYYLLLVWGVKTVAAAAGLVFGIFVALPAMRLLPKHAVWGPWAEPLLAVLEVLAVISSIGLWAYSWFLVRLDYDKRWYIVTDRSLRVREGVLWVREATVTFANIQNISISQGPLQRLLGIADLRVDTAGGGGASVEHEGLQSLHTTFFRGVDNASEIQSLMQQRLKRLKDAGLGDHDDRSLHAVPTTIAAGLDMDALRAIHAEAGLLREAVAQRARPQPAT